VKLLGITSVYFDVINKILIRYSAFVRCWRKKWQYSGTVLIYTFEKAYDPVKKEVFYNILIELSIFVKIIEIITMRLNETNIKVRKDKNRMHFISRIV